MKILVLFTIIFACSFLENVVSNAKSFSYQAIFNFGDSISDTGNAAHYAPVLPSNSPYGSTYFKHPSGRVSNGRLIIDFIATSYGVPMLPAYLNLTKGQNIKKGVNFAYAGATALDMKFFEEKNIKINAAAAFSLSTQFDWFKKLKSSLCESKKECDSYFKNSLFIIGEIGGNDINAIIPDKNISKLQQMVPPIINAITNITTKLIEEGVVELVVPGNFPIGCNPAVLTIINSDKNNDYDQYGCLKPYNAFIRYYNGKLQKAIRILRRENPHVKITYFDYYGATIRLVKKPLKYGFSFGQTGTLKACCGKGEPYNFSPQIYCGSPNSTVCSDPSKHINWDGLHYTETANRLIAKGLVQGPFANPSLKSPPFNITKN